MADGAVDSRIINREIEETGWKEMKRLLGIKCRESLMREIHVKYRD